MDRARSALDARSPRAALDAINRELAVKRDDQLPNDLHGDDALMVLNRAAVQQAAGAIANSQRDYEAADKALDFLDLSHATVDELGRWLYSDSAGRYVAPAHEKVLLNALNMLNYLEQRDLSGAAVEARRLAVMSRYLQSREGGESEAMKLGALLAGFAFERSGNLDEARIWYERAGAPGPATGPSAESGDRSELLLVVGWGRVPHRVANYVPLGQAVFEARRSTGLSFEGSGVLTQVHYPTLALERAPGPRPEIMVDDEPAAIDDVLDVTKAVKSEWSRVQGRIYAAAITRALAREALWRTGQKLGEAAADESSSKEMRTVSGLLAIASLLGAAGATVADVPDTRSWETLPARIAVVRMKVKPGAHRVHLAVSGATRDATLIVPGDGYAAASLFAPW